MYPGTIVHRTVSGKATRLITAQQVGTPIRIGHKRFKIQQNTDLDHYTYVVLSVGTIVALLQRRG